MLDLMRAAAWTGFMVSFPVLAVALGAGLAIGLVQALTSIQELTLTFVPKLVAILLVFWVSIDFMIATLVDFFHGGVLRAVAGA